VAGVPLLTPQPQSKKTRQAHALKFILSPKMLIIIMIMMKIMMRMRMRMRRMMMVLVLLLVLLLG